MHLLSLGTKRLTLVLGILAAIAWTLFITTDSNPRYWDTGEWAAFFVILVLSAAGPRLIALVIAWIAEGYRCRAAPQSAPVPRQRPAIADAAQRHGTLSTIFVCVAIVLLALAFWAGSALALEAVGEGRSGKATWILTILIGTIVWLFWKNPLSLGQRVVAFVVIAGTACFMGIAGAIIGTQITLSIRTVASAAVGTLVAMLPPVLGAYYVGLQFHRRVQ